MTILGKNAVENSTSDPNKQEELRVVEQWSREVDALVREMNPTKNGPVSVKSFMEAVQCMFNSRGWDFEMYCARAMETHLHSIKTR